MLFLDHSTRVEVSRTTFLVLKSLEIGAEVSQSVLMPKCLVAEVSGNPCTSHGCKVQVKDSSVDSYFLSRRGVAV